MFAATVALIGCDRPPPPLDDCAGPLTGVWQVTRADGAAVRALGGAPLQFHAIGTRATWELLPIVDDGRREPAADGRGARMVAPGAIELARVAAPAAESVGEYARRYEQDGALCIMRSPVRLHGCAGATIHLDIALPPPPDDVARCAATPAAPPETWTLTRAR